MLRTLILITITRAIFGSNVTLPDEGVEKVRVRRDLGHSYYIGRIYGGQTRILMTKKASESIYSTDHPPIVISNVGTEEFHAEAIEGNYDSWHTVIVGKTLQPDEKTILRTSGSRMYTALKVYNPTDNVAIFYAKRGFGPNGLNVPPPSKLYEGILPLDIGIVDLLKMYAEVQVIGAAFSQNFAVGFASNILLQTFFPSKKEDPWDNIEGKVKALIKESELTVISAILSNEVKPYKDKIKDATDNTGSRHIREIYMNVYQQMIGLEKKFYFEAEGIDNAELNFRLLPFFSRCINMKISFISWGIAYATNLTLDEDDVSRIRKHALSVIDYAVATFELVEEKQSTNIYVNLDPDFLFDKHTELRTSVAVHGKEYFNSWVLAIDPTQFIFIYDPPSYSQYFGSSSPNMWKQAFLFFGSPPLTPTIKFVDGGKRMAHDGLKSVRVYYHSEDENKIIGMTQVFASGEQYSLCSQSDKYDKFDLNGAYIASLTAIGAGKIDCLKFNLTDNRVIEYGYACNGETQHTFLLENHIVLSMYVADDNGRKDKQIVNIAVSYVINPTIKDRNLTEVYAAP